MHINDLWEIIWTKQFLEFKIAYIKYFKIKFGFTNTFLPKVHRTIILVSLHICTEAYMGQVEKKN